MDPAAERALIDQLIEKEYPELDAFYHDAHAHPELGFQETRTAAILDERMRALGFTVTEKVGCTGLVIQ
jgi:hippurate hydrolase